jgi:hypothetical protein
MSALLFETKRFDQNSVMQSTKRNKEDMPFYQSLAVREKCWFPVSRNASRILQGQFSGALPMEIKNLGSRRNFTAPPPFIERK